MKHAPSSDRSGQCRVRCLLSIVRLCRRNAPRLPMRPCAATQAAVRTLVAQHADVNAPQADGATALHWAVFRSDKEMVDLLIRAGANAKAANREGATPLWLASVNGDAAIIEALIKAGADPNEQLPLGRTPLMVASRTGNVDAMKVLLDHGADVNAKETLRGTTPLMWAADEGHARCDQAADRARRGHQGPIGSGRARARAGARKIQRSQKAGRGAGRGARRRTSVAAPGRRSCDARLVRRSGGRTWRAGRRSRSRACCRRSRGRHGSSGGLHRTMPQPPRSVLADSAVDERW